MLLVIMTRSLIRLDSAVRASLNNDCMTNRYDERQIEVECGDENDYGSGECGDEGVTV